jgi:hypothetical protein
VRYQLQARKGLIGEIGITAGCGVDEPPRQALLGVLARLDWAPDWSLHPRFRVLPTRPLDRCEVTIADIDVAPLVGSVFEERIETTLTGAMRALAPRMQHLRGEAVRIWDRIQTPRELIPSLWLHIQPLGLAMAPPQGAGSHVQTAVWLAFRAQLSDEPQRPSAPTPLPPLAPYRPLRPGLHLALELQIDYPKLSAALSERLAGQTMRVQGQMAQLNGITISANGDDLFLVADLSGDLAGTLTVMGRPGFDTATQVLRLEDVDFVFDAADTDQGLMANLFYDRIRSRIETVANTMLAERTKRLHSALTAALTTALPPNLAPDLTSLSVADLRFSMGEVGLSIAGIAGGVLRVAGSHSPAQP